MKRKISLKLLSLAMAFVLLLSVCPVAAQAVTQGDVDAMRAERDAIRAKREEKQAVVDQLEEEQAGVLERKRVMDERNEYTLQQIQLNNEEMAIYDAMIEAKAREVDTAKALEDEQLQRYRVRVRAMEENGGYGILTMVLRTSNLTEFLTAMDDVGEIMQSDKELEDAYRAARQNTEKVKAEYESVKTELEAKKQELQEQQEELQAEIDEATQLIAALQEDIDNNREEYEAILAEEEAADRELSALVAELERQRQENANAKRRKRQPLRRPRQNPRRRRADPPVPVLPPPLRRWARASLAGPFLPVPISPAASGSVSTQSPGSRRATPASILAPATARPSWRRTAARSR